MEKHGLRVTVVAVGPQPALHDDHAIVLYQTIRELLFNVLKHARTHEASVSIRRTDDGTIEATVQDRGTGFDSATVADHSAGQRFGLFNVRERLEALGGSFELRSAPGQGTEASLRLPAAAVPEPALGVEAGGGFNAAPMVQATPGMIRVLLVDDHAMVRQGLRSVLDGYLDVEVVGEACDGHEAVNSVGPLRPHVVVMDLNMPKLDGIEATRLITTRYPDVAVIGLSVNATAQNEAAMIEAGAALLLTKEAAVDRLYEAIQQARKPLRDASH
jgi:CheY-like chemotaxis protein